MEFNDTKAAFALMMFGLFASPILLVILAVIVIGNLVGRGIVWFIDGCGK